MAENNQTEGGAGAVATAAEANSVPAAPEMRCISLTGFGGLRQIKVSKKPAVTPKEGEVLIRVKACGLNFNDLIIRQGALDNPPKPPFVMGLELAGEVEALGENVDRFAPWLEKSAEKEKDKTRDKDRKKSNAKEIIEEDTQDSDVGPDDLPNGSVSPEEGKPEVLAKDMAKDVGSMAKGIAKDMGIRNFIDKTGLRKQSITANQPLQIGDRVIAVTDCQAWAELVAVPAQFVYRMPTGMSFQDGAALLLNYLTAYILLFDIGSLRKGQSVLIHSVGGGVGHAVCQLCKTIPDITLFGTASYNKHDAIKNSVNHLFDHVVDYCQEIRKVSPEGVDVVLDCLCGEDTNRGISILKPLGKYVLYGSANIVTGETKSFFSFAKSWWQVDKISPIKLYDENKTISGFSLRQMLFRQNRHEYIRDIVNTLFQMYNDGKIRPRIDSAWAFEDVTDAMQKMHDRKNIGKILLDPSLQPKQKEAPQNQSSDSQQENSGAEEKKEGASE